jgi:hypothetical protein
MSCAFREVKMQVTRIVTLRRRRTAGHDPTLNDDSENGHSREQREPSDLA